MSCLHSCVLKHLNIFPKKAHGPSFHLPQKEPQRIPLKANDEEKPLMRFNEINCSVNIKRVQRWDVYVARFCKLRLGCWN